MQINIGKWREGGRQKVMYCGNIFVFHNGKLILSKMETSRNKERKKERKPYDSSFLMAFHHMFTEPQKDLLGMNIPIAKKNLFEFAL